jgi:GNAT superfamily N-acetyltransferase
MGTVAPDIGQEPERDLLADKLKKMIQKVVLLRRTYNFVVVDERDFARLPAEGDCRLVQITADNYHRVGEFRPRTRITQYRKKLESGEIGYFVEYHGRMIGSNWATVNRDVRPRIVRSVIRLAPNEGLTHDGVIAPSFRGQGFGAFMISRLVEILMQEFKLSRIIIDVNVKNKASLRMMEKAGFRVDHKMLHLALFDRLIFQRVLERYDRVATPTFCAETADRRHPLTELTTKGGADSLAQDRNGLTRT